MLDLFVPILQGMTGLLLSRWVLEILLTDLDWALCVTVPLLLALQTLLWEN